MGRPTAARWPPDRALGLRSREGGDCSAAAATPRVLQAYQLQLHKDRELNRAMMQKAKDNGIKVRMLTVDSITGGMAQFAVKPTWAIYDLLHERFSLPQLDAHIDMKGNRLTIGRIFTEMPGPTMNWQGLAAMVQERGRGNPRFR